MPHVAPTVRVVDAGARTEDSERLRTDEVLLTRQAREIAALSASVSALRAALAAGLDTPWACSTDQTALRPPAATPTTTETTCIMPTECSPASQRPEIKQYVLPTVFSNNGSLIDVFA